MQKRTRKRPQVAVLIPLALKGHRDSFEGILRYARLHTSWRIYHMEGRSGEQQLLDLKRWGCTGIITGSCSLKEAQLLKQTRVPIVVFEPSPAMREKNHPLAKCSHLVFDSYATGSKAADYFFERHYTNFAFVGEPHDVYWSKEREHAFYEKIKAAGHKCLIYPTPEEHEWRDWAAELPRMKKWLKSLPKPTALFAAMDGRARQVLDACMSAKITVPDDIAVLGVDDDPLICEATFPPLSSIQTNSEYAGFQMAKHLDDLMQGRRRLQQRFVVSPVSIITRRSTEATAIANRLVLNALEFIWREAPQRPLQVPDVVAIMGSSRRFAEMQFKTTVGRTIMEEIRRVKLERVCALLVETNLPISEICFSSGFSNESHLAVLFRKSFAMTMSAYRASFHGSDNSTITREKTGSIITK